MKNHQHFHRKPFVCLLTALSLLVSVLPFRACAADCAPSPSGLVSWWRAEGTPADEVGGNHGTASGGVAFEAGRVGQAFVFNGTGAVLQFGNPTNLQMQNFTIETWLKRASTSAVSLNGNGNGVVFGYGNGGYGNGNSGYFQNNYSPVLNYYGRWNYSVYRPYSSGGYSYYCYNSPSYNPYY